MKRPKFNPALARGDLFEPNLFDTKAQPSAPAATTPPPAAGSDATPAAARTEKVVAAVAPQSDLTVTAFSELVTRALEDGLRGNYRIAGEITNLSRHNHWYFSVKDAASVLSCVMWASDASRVAFQPREGDAVVVTGRIGHYAAQGRTQLYASKLEPQGVGALELRFQQLVKELREKGYFLDSHKKALPLHPRRVAVVTSKAGAALGDVLKTANERRAGVEFVVVDVRVQGDAAADEVARALRALDRRRVELGIDAVIVTRGGGSREDLWAFNERVVADAAFALHLPLIAAIGHEVDTSVIELVADRRASTPTQAVMLLLPDSRALEERRDRLARDLRNAVRWSLQSRRDELARLAAHEALASPVLRIAHERTNLLTLRARLRAALTHASTQKRRSLEALHQRLARNAPAVRAATARALLATLLPRLRRAAALRMSREQTTLRHLETRLRSAGPDATLARGYAIVTTARGELVKTVAAAAAGAKLDLQLSDGRVHVRVDGTEQKGDSAPKAARGAD